MSARMSRVRLDRELACRGWSASDLARASGISAATISKARHGRPVTHTTLRRIADALVRVPTVPGVDQLLEQAEP